MLSFVVNGHVNGVQGEPHAVSPVGVSAGPTPPCPGEGLLWEAVEDDGAGG
jgi:hypothetical protein